MIPAATQLPTGTLTFVFTDVEGFTRLLQELGPAYDAVQQDHVRLLREAIAGNDGVEVGTEGDAFFAVFRTPAAAVRAAVDAQRAIARHRWPHGRPLRVRMGMHTGEGRLEGGTYLGIDVNLAARIAAAGHGGQVLLSEATRILVERDLPEGVRVRGLGSHRLKDFADPQRLADLVIEELPADFPPIRTLEVPSNLPAQLTTFVGRHRELAELRRLLDAHRLVTLLGPGGSGKTRLAIRAASEQTAAFPGGVYFAELAAARDPEAAVAAIARAMGVKASKEQTLLEEVKRHLRDREVLLVLDNFEQVTVASPVVAELLQAAPRVKAIVTSREPLHVRGEQRLPVPPLALPEGGGDGARGRPSAAGLGAFEAVQLFVDRAVAVRPDFELTDDNAPVVADICRRLDGLPLAIELATARLNLLSVEALRDRLAKSLVSLHGGVLDLPDRQQTLRSTIRWSHDLLEPGEQRLFALLSTFSTASVEAVEGVAAESGLFDDLDPLDGLASLLDKSLVRHADAGAPEPRVAMLQAIREFAAERLDEQPELAAAARRAHAAWFADLARREWPRLAGRERDAAMSAIAADLENLRIAWRFWVGERDLERLDKLVDTLWLLHEDRGRYQGTAELTTDLLDVLSSVPPSAERAEQEMALRASLGRVLLAIRGYTQEAEEAYVRAIELFEGPGEIPRLLPVLRAMAGFYTYRGEFEKAAEIGRELLRLAEQQDDPTMRVEGHFVVGTNVAFTDDPVGGLEHLEAALAQAPERTVSRFRLGAQPIVTAHTTSAFLLWLLGQPDRARDRAEAAVRVAERLEHPFSMAYAHFHAGFLRLWRREFERVEELAAGLLALVERHDFVIWRAVGLALLGAARTGLDRGGDGLALIRQGLELYQGLKTPPVFWPMLRFAQAGACLRVGSPAEARASIDEALAIAGGSTGKTLAPEFLTLKGDVTEALGDGDPEPWWEQSLAISAELGLRMCQLRAATRLARRWGARGEGARGAALLRPIHESFSEGFETRDLIEAQEALAALD